MCYVLLLLRMGLIPDSRFEYKKRQVLMACLFFLWLKVSQNYWQDFFKKMKKFLKKSLMFWWKLFDEFTNGPWRTCKRAKARLSYK